jgi:prevent-host-death family protein
VARLSATEAARRFSEVLNRVSAGEEIEITRGGETIAVLVPFRARLLSAERFRALMASVPPVDEGFAEELRKLRAAVGPPRERGRSDDTDVLVHRERGAGSPELEALIGNEACDQRHHRQ